MRRKLARAMRKWADLIDPETKPVAEESVSFRIGIDIHDAMLTLRFLGRQIDQLQRRAAQLPRP